MPERDDKSQAATTAIVTASISDAEALAGVEIESKLKSIPNCIDEGDVNFPKRLARWQGYLSGTASPQHAKAERQAFKAIHCGRLIGFIAGHLTTRHNRDAEIQLFYVLKEHQRAGVGRKLLIEMVNWFVNQHAGSACVGIAPENPYQRFYLKFGGTYLNPHWIVWDNLSSLQSRLRLDQGLPPLAYDGSAFQAE
jgi:GNAT superfamily N-acetyltransferase